MRRRFIMFGMLLAAASAAQAQIEVAPMDMAGAMFNRQVMRGQLENIIGQDGSRRSRGGVGPQSYNRPSTPSSVRLRQDVNTRYRRDPAVTRKVKNDYLAFVARTAPAELGVIRDDLQRSDPVAVWNQRVAADGFKPGDAVDAIAAYWLVNWMIANDQTNSAREAEGVRTQVRAILASQPRFAALSEAQRQEISESLIVNFNYQINGYFVLKMHRDAARLRQAAAAAAVRFNDQVGLDPRTLTVSNHGFVKRG